MSLVTRLVAPNPGPLTGAGTNTYLVGQAHKVVIDPGPADPAHVRRIRETAGRITAVLVTHDHPDHAPGARLLDAPRPGVKDGQPFVFPWGTLHALSTPGHATPHFAFYFPEERALFSGDLVPGEGTVVIQDLAAYVASLERMLTLDLEVLYPGHGPVVSRPEQRLREILDHRRRREAQILEALARGPATVRAIRQAVYPELDAALHAFAEGNVRVHLEKLAGEGQAERSGRRWRRVG